MGAITIQQMVADAKQTMDEAFDEAYKDKYIAVQTRKGVWLVVKRTAYSGDEPKLRHFDVRVRACKDQQEAEAFVKLLKEN
jgi:hypothetical protein